MANQCGHEHTCVECGKPYKCENPECMTLPGAQGACGSCSYLHGWARAKEQGNDWSAL